MCGSDERIAYYNKHRVAYVARPPHGKDGFMRGGRFKKASNMNFCMTVSQQVSQVMQARLSMAPVINAPRVVQACIGDTCNAASVHAWPGLAVSFVCRAVIKCISIAILHRCLLSADRTDRQTARDCRAGGGPRR